MKNPICAYFVQPDKTNRSPRKNGFNVFNINWIVF